MMRVTTWCLGVLALFIAALIGWIYMAGRPPQSSPAQYVALGSSYASVVTAVTAGPSSHSIIDRASDSPWFCGRSSDNYPHQLSKMRGLTLVDVSCGGAVARHVLKGGQMLQPAQIDALRPDTELVTLTIGGNDINYVGNMMAYGCGQRSDGLFKVVQAIGGCRPMPQDKVRAELKALPESLDQIAAEIHRRSPQARLVFLTYQTVLPASGTCPKLGLTEAQADGMRLVAAALADAQRGAAARAGALLFDAAAATAGHDVCAQQPWISDQEAPLPLHTTLEGMTAIAQGLNRMLGAPEASSSDAPGLWAKQRRLLEARYKGALIDPAGKQTVANDRNSPDNDI